MIQPPLMECCLYRHSTDMVLKQNSEVIQHSTSGKARKKLSFFMSKLYLCLLISLLNLN